MYKLGHPSVIQPSDWNPKLERAVNCNGAIGFRHESQHHYQPTPLLRQPTKKSSEPLLPVICVSIWSLEKSGGRAWYGGWGAVREAPLSEAARSNPMASKYPPTLSQL